MTFTNNVALAPWSSPDRKSDWITQLTPGLAVSERSAHTRFAGTVSVPLLLYARTSDNNDVLPEVNLTGNVELVPRLLALGAAWNELRLSARSMSVAYFGVLYGSYANWAVTTLSAILGTTAMTPIAGAGHRGADWQEALVTAGFVSVGVVMIAVAAILISGFRAWMVSAKQDG
jgi:hydroxylaminobenzene mutase